MLTSNVLCCALPNPATVQQTFSHCFAMLCCVLCCASVDRLSLELPGRQPDLIKALARRAPGLPLVVVLMHGGGLDVSWMLQIPAVKAILSVPFPGQVRCSCLVGKTRVERRQC